MKILIQIEFGFFVLVASWLAPCCTNFIHRFQDSSDHQEQSDDQHRGGAESSDRKSNEIHLFDGKTLDGWRMTNFGGEGEVLIEEKVIVLEQGYPLTGITWDKPGLPTNQYELEVIARKTSGTDFFCGLTFPINDQFCTLIVGGWGGGLVGLSMIDGQDAARNETKKLMRFEKDRWYRIRIKVELDNLSAWIDDDKMVDLPTEGKSFSVRNETLPTRPLGICNFETRTEIQSVILRRLGKAVDQKEAAEEK